MVVEGLPEYVSVVPLSVPDVAEVVAVVVSKGWAEAVMAVTRAERPTELTK